MHESRALSTPGPAAIPAGVRQHLWAHLGPAAGPCLPGLVEPKNPLGKRLVYVCQTVKCVMDTFASLIPCAGVEKRQKCSLVLSQTFGFTLCLSFPLRNHQM